MCPPLARLLVGLVAVAMTAPTVAPTSARAAEPAHRVKITALSGASLVTWPAYDPAVDRFALRPEGRTDGLAVTVTSSDEAAVITVEGRPTASGQHVKLPEAGAGDEVNVQVVGASGASNQPWVVLPEDFP